MCFWYIGMYAYFRVPSIVDLENSIERYLYTETVLRKIPGTN